MVARLDRLTNLAWSVRPQLQAALSTILKDNGAKLSGVVRLLLSNLKLELEQLTDRLYESDALIQHTTHESDACRHPMLFPELGPSQLLLGWRHTHFDTPGMPLANNLPRIAWAGIGNGRRLPATL
jgi:hypothetical protein